MRTPNSRTRRRMLNAMTAYWPMAAISSDITEKMTSSRAIIRAT
jgi:hypothetical protein